MLQWRLAGRCGWDRGNTAATNVSAGAMGPSNSCVRKEEGAVLFGLLGLNHVLVQSRNIKWSPDFLQRSSHGPAPLENVF